MTDRNETKVNILWNELFQVKSAYLELTVQLQETQQHNADLTVALEEANNKVKELEEQYADKDNDEVEATDTI